MSVNSWKIPLLLGAAIALSGATCQSKSGSRASEDHTGHDHSDGQAIVAQSAEADADSGAGGPGPESLSAPGMDFSQLSEPARKELAAVLSDEFCPCGCPHTIGQCLKQHAPCRHSKRAATLAARHANAGFPGSEIILILSRYYEGFRAPRKAFQLDPQMCQGAADAPITLVEFFDYECPSCGAVGPVLKAFAKKYAARVRFCAVPFPLAGHPNSIPATQAALVAREAGKFWPMHDALLEHQMDLSNANIRTIAAGTGVSAEAVGQAISGGKFQDTIAGFREMGKAAGVGSTPTLFLNGRKFQLDVNEENLVHTVDDELEWSHNKGAWAAD